MEIPLTKNVVKALLKHYLGPYLKNELCIEQIKAQLGKIELQDLEFDIKVTCFPIQNNLI
jgi:hypothetical protein